MSTPPPKNELKQLKTKKRKWPVCTYEHLFSQAAKWVKNMEKDNKLVVIKYSDPNYISLIQNAVYVNCHIYYYMYQRVPGPQLCYSHTECGLFNNGNFSTLLLLNFASNYHHYILYKMRSIFSLLSLLVRFPNPLAPGSDSKVTSRYMSVGEPD